MAALRSLMVPCLLLNLDQGVVFAFCLSAAAAKKRCKPSKTKKMCYSCRVPEAAQNIGSNTACVLKKLDLRQKKAQRPQVRRIPCLPTSRGIM